MKINSHKLLLAALMLALLCPATNAFATLYTFTPPDADLYDLDHYYNYAWGINQDLEPNEVITWARLTIRNINNWAIEENDILYMEVLDIASLGITSSFDNQLGGNNFTSWGSDHLFLTSYTDDDDGPNGDPENINYYFNAGQLAALNDYISDGNFGLGFDPDCHYWNDRVKFRFNTEIRAVPEPASLTLMAGGLLGSMGLRRRKRT